MFYAYDKMYLCGIMYGCPSGRREEVCPLFQVEHLSFIERMNWLNEQHDERKMSILKYHMKCSKNGNNRS